MATASSAVATPAVATPSAARSSKPWLRGAFLLAGAAQLITISALLSADPLAATWSALLLAVAPVLLTAVAAFTPPALALPAAVAAAVALIVGIIGGISHTGPLFIPSLVLLVIGGARLWQARSQRG